MNDHVNDERGRGALRGLWLALMFGSLVTSAGAAPKPPDARQQALRVLRLRYPEVSWQLERTLQSDFTGDGEGDLAVQGNRGRDFSVGVIVAPIGPLSTMLSMTWAAAANPESSACVNAVAPQLVTEAIALPADLWGCAGEDVATESCASVRILEEWLLDAAARGVQGLRVTGDRCEELHLYWNPQSKQFDYWKAAEPEAQ